MSIIRFDAPPTVGRFMHSDAPVRLIAGPVGSGKTTGCIFELLRRAIEQRPASDGTRYTRFAIVRQTLEQLKMTVLKDIQLWLPGIHDYRISEKTVYVRFTAEDGTRVNSEWLMIPLEDQADQRRLLSSQLTGAWMSEAIEMDIGLVSPLRGRCGRFPGPAQGGASWHGIIADTNMPTQGSQWHAKMTREKPDTWAVFIQPGGLEPNAENLNFLLQTPQTLALPFDHPDRVKRGRQYYIDAMDGADIDWVNRYVHARFGADPSGQTVFRHSFKLEEHVVEDLEPIKNQNLIVSQDFGRNPFGLIGQRDERGRILVLEELRAEGMGLAQHVQENLRPVLLSERYYNLPFFIVGDPSGVERGQVTDVSPFTYLRSQNFQAYPAPTNNIDKRLEAVSSMLVKRFADGPALLIDRDRCPTLVDALNSRYRYTKRMNGQLSPRPEKLHPWSDAADALQYLCLVAGTGYGEHLARHVERTNAMRIRPAPRRRMPVGGWA